MNPAFTCFFCIMLLATQGQTTHFDIVFNYDHVSINEKTTYIIEDSYRSINSYFGTCPDKIKVYIIGKEKMDQLGGYVQAFSSTRNDTNIIAIREETLKDSKSLSEVLKHEICHLAVNEIFHDKSEKQYQWMEEGVCMLFSGERLSDKKVAQYIVKNGFLDTKGITDAVDSKDYPVIKNGYFHSYSLCKFISDRYGEESLVKILKYPDDNFYTAFYEVTGDDFPMVYQKWKTSILYDSGNAQPVYTGGLPVFA